VTSRFTIFIEIPKMVIWLAITDKPAV